MSKHPVRSPGQNTLGTGPLRFMTPERSAPWAGGTASAFFVPFPQSHRLRVDHDPAAIPIASFDYRTNSAISVARRSYRIRLYSTKTYKSLGTLDYHKDGIQAMTFARSTPPISWPSQNQSGVDRGGSRTGVTPTSVGGGDAAGDDEEEDEFGNSEFEARKRWLVAGGKDGRISVWELMDFAKPKP